MTKTEFPIIVPSITLEVNNQTSGTAFFDIFRRCTKGISFKYSRKITAGIKAKGEGDLCLGRTLQKHLLCQFDFLHIDKAAGRNPYFLLKAHFKLRNRQHTAFGKIIDRDIRFYMIVDKI